MPHLGKWVAFSTILMTGSFWPTCANRDLVPRHHVGQVGKCLVPFTFGRVQSCSRRTCTSAHAPGRMETPPPGGPADLERLLGCTGRPVCQSGHIPLPVILLPDQGDPLARMLWHTARDVTINSEPVENRYKYATI